MLKQDIKIINAEFIWAHAFIPTFLRLAETLCNLIPVASSLFDINAKK